jgi:uncharacterized protein (DUF342 family)
MAKELAECIKLQTEADGLEGYLSITPGYDPAEVTAEILLAQLKAIGVVARWLDNTAVRDLAARCQSHPDVTYREMVAQGCAPTHGLPGSVDLHERIRARIREIEHRAESLKEANPERGEAEEGATDFRSQSAFIFVAAGQEVAVVNPPTDGLDGQNVFGETVAARPGKPCSMRLGSGVRLDEDNRVRASVHGVLKYKNNQISVSETLRVGGSVDYSTGNIDFTGDVEVVEQVRDCFVVDSGGSVQIKGLVEAATIRAKHELQLSGGMAGRETGEFFAGRGLRARYIDKTKGVVHSHCVIEKEMNWCDLTVYGEVDSPNAAMRGGRCSATKGMTIGVLGGAGCIATEVLIGHMPEPEALIDRIQGLIRELEGVVAEATARLDQLLAATSTVTDTLKKELDQIKAERKINMDRLSVLRLRAVSLVRQVDESTRYSLRIMHKACPGVRVWMPGYQIEVREEFKGPVEILLGKDHRVQLIDLKTGSALTTEGVLRIEKDETILPIPDPSAFQSAA